VPSCLVSAGNCPAIDWRTGHAALLRRSSGSGRRAAPSYHPAPGELAELRWAITRRDGAAFVHNAAAFVKEHRRYAQRWDLAAIARDLDGTVALYVGGSPRAMRRIRARSATGQSQGRPSNNSGSQPST
jgi:hypothetical protein